MVKLTYRFGGYLPDRLSVGDNRQIVIREVAAQALLAGCDLPRDLVSIPTEVVDKTGRNVLATDYILLTAEEEYDVLDHSTARYISMHGGGKDEVVISVREWSVLSANAPALDAFPAVPNDWIVTEVFKTVWEVNGFSGAKFIPLPISD